MAGTLTVTLTDDGFIKMDSGGLSGIELLGCAEYVRAVVATDMVHTHRAERKRAAEVPNGPAPKLLTELCKECSSLYTSLHPLNSCKDHEGYAKL